MPEETKERENHPVYDFYFDTLKFCGCGNPEEAVAFIRDVLRATKNRFERTGLTNAAFNELTKKENELLPLDSPLALCFRYWMDTMGWTEHGGAVFGAWLTDKGEAVLALLESTTDLEDALKNPWERDHAMDA